MFSWLRRDKTRDQEVRSYLTVIEGLKEMYKTKLMPLEKEYKYGEFHSPYLNAGDFDAKPMVLLIGQYSTGKTTFIRYLLERDFPGMRIGPEPTTDRFVSIMHGPHDQNTPGNALAVDPNRQFRNLQQFGNAFLSRFEGSFLDSDVLKSITLIDTPGILSGEKQRVHRGYDFEAVLEWFADRADMIILLFDAHKLDISDEFQRVIHSIKRNQEKIRIVLNKADMVTTQQLMRVYGALMWSLGKVVNSPEVVRVYIGSFWDKQLQFDENRQLFEAEQEDLFADIQSLPRTAAVRKLNEMIKRARLAKVHAYIINHLRGEMPSLFGKQSKKDELIANLANVFHAIQKRYQLPIGDFPPVRRMQQQLEEYDFTRFPKLNQALIDTVDVMLAKDLTRIMQLLPKEEEAIKDTRIKGGAFGHTEADPFSNKRDLTKESTYSAYDEGWIVSPDAAKFDAIFEKLGPNAQGKISGATAREEMMKSKLPNSVLRRIWNLSDIDGDGMLDRDEFAVAKFLIEHKLAGNDIPEKLPDRLIPPSKRSLKQSRPSPRDSERSMGGRQGTSYSMDEPNSYGGQSPYGGQSRGRGGYGGRSMDQYDNDDDDDDLGQYIQ
jgi:GTPase SAR1 family protein